MLIDKRTKRVTDTDIGTDSDIDRDKGNETDTTTIHTYS